MVHLLLYYYDCSTGVTDRLLDKFDVLHTCAESAPCHQLGNLHYHDSLVQSEGAKYVEGEAEVQDATLDNVGWHTQAGENLMCLFLDIEG